MVFAVLCKAPQKNCFTACFSCFPPSSQKENIGLLLLITYFILIKAVLVPPYCAFSSTLIFRATLSLVLGGTLHWACWIICTQQRGTNRASQGLFILPAQCHWGKKFAPSMTSSDIQIRTAWCWGCHEVLISRRYYYIEENLNTHTERSKIWYLAQHTISHSHKENKKKTLFNCLAIKRNGLKPQGGSNNSHLS